ncbi:MAG: hypothetical protein L0170_01385, partial [Acidobacteria bacterium]|nr:hypothetical protein [Acidobacteriota bacterium]
MKEFVHVVVLLAMAAGCSAIPRTTEGDMDHPIDRVLEESAIIAEAREGAPVFGVDSEWKMYIWYLLPPQERQLVGLGAPARDRLLDVVRRSAIYPLQRATLLQFALGEVIWTAPLGAAA